MTIFIGTQNADTIAPGLVSQGVKRIGPDATPGAGDDLITARSGDDVVAGGLGDDIAFLGAGDDLFLWAPADGSDRVYGQDGFDTLAFDGSNDAERFGLTGARLTRDVGDVTMRLWSLERIDLFAGGGADRIELAAAVGGGLQELHIDLAGVKGSGAGDGHVDTVVLNGDVDEQFLSIGNFGETVSVVGLDAFVEIRGAEAQDRLIVNGGGGDDFFGASTRGAVVALTLDGGAGDDQLFAGAGDDLLLGGAGRDFVDGGRGDDVARLGAGDDIFVWRDGDGSDRVDGQGGDDSLDFEGAAASETIRLFADGGRTAITRDLGAITMDLDGIERITLRPLGGDEDIVAVDDLTGTDVESVEVNLSLPGRSGDGARDAVDLTGGAAAAEIKLVSAGATVTVEGLPASVEVVGVEADDALTVTGGAGDDRIDASGVAEGVGRLGFDGAGGDDLIIGNAKTNALLGGDGDDIVIGGKGDDNAFLGAGDDRFLWAPGDDNDFIDGDVGVDTLEFLGANADEVIDIVANRSQAVFLRDVAAVRMDLDEVERIEFSALGGEDVVTVGDLGATDVSEVVIDLSAAAGGGDGAADRIVIDARGGDGGISIDRDGGAVVVSGLSATIRILGAETGLDDLVFVGLGAGAFVATSDLGTSGKRIGGAGSQGFWLADASDASAGAEPLPDEPAAFADAGVDALLF